MRFRGNTKGGLSGQLMTHSEHLASTVEDNAMKTTGMIYVWALELVLVIACQRLRLFGAG